MPSPASEQELLTRAGELAGQRLGAIAAAHNIPSPENLKRAKGWVGEMLESVLGATAQSRPVPDFEHLGIELKTIPLNLKHEPQESTFVSSVPLIPIPGLQWESSSVCAKLRRVLWVPVEAAHSIPLSQRRIGQAILWSPSRAELTILRDDWEEHMEYIALGQVDRLDARLGTYLQVRPKAYNRRGLTATISADGERTRTLPRGFYLRTSFTRQILNNH